MRRQIQNGEFREELASLGFFWFQQLNGCDSPFTCFRRYISSGGWFAHQAWIQDIEQQLAFAHWPWRRPFFAKKILIKFTLWWDCYQQIIAAWNFLVALYADSSRMRDHMQDHVPKTRSLTAVARTKKPLGVDHAVVRNQNQDKSDEIDLPNILQNNLQKIAVLVLLHEIQHSSLSPLFCFGVETNSLHADFGPKRHQSHKARQLMNQTIVSFCA